MTKDSESVVKNEIKSFLDQKNNYLTNSNLSKDSNIDELLKDGKISFSVLNNLIANLDDCSEKFNSAILKELTLLIKSLNEVNFDDFFSKAMEYLKSKNRILNALNKNINPEYEFNDSISKDYKLDSINEKNNISINNESNTSIISNDNQNITIKKINYGKDSYYYGYANVIIDEKTKITEFCKNGFGTFSDQGNKYFVGNFDNNKYKEGIYWNKSTNEVYIGNFTYINAPVVDDVDKNNTQNYYHIEGVKLENFDFTKKTQDYLILIGNINDFQDKNNNRELIFNGIQTSALCQNLLYLSHEYALKIDFTENSLQILLKSENSDQLTLYKRSTYLLRLDNKNPDLFFAYYLKININSNDSGFYETYFGQISGDSFLPDGSGVVYFNSKENNSDEIDVNEYFEGNFINGVKQGKGRYVRNHKVLLEGDFNDDAFIEGTIVNFNSNKKFYQGKFDNGFPNTGAIFYDNGDVFEGEIEDIFVRKQGEYKYVIDGSILKISYNEGKKNGEGLYIQKKNNEETAYKVVFKDNELVELSQVSNNNSSI